MKHQESNLQIRCLKWFRYQYPYLANLMFHPRNEGNGNRRQGAIAKAEGVVPGVADIMLSLPSVAPDGFTYHSLAIEMKTPQGRQSREQRTFELFLTAAGSDYHVVRDYDTFVDVVNDYVSRCPERTLQAIRILYARREQQKQEEARAEFKKLLNAQQ